MDMTVMVDGEPYLTRWEIPVPMVARDKAGNTRPWTLNDRVHWRRQREWTKTIRTAVGDWLWYSRVAPQKHVHVSLHYAPGNNRRRDTDNLVATAKPAVDGIVDARIVPDDTAEYVTRTGPFIHPGPGERRLWLVVEVRGDGST
jgi:crossover junction endodeoxyribonuclease RusA